MSDIAGGIGSYLGGRAQAAAVKDAQKRQIKALEQAARQLDERYEEALADAGPNVFGRTPDAALFQPINLGASQIKSIGANQSALEAADNLASGANEGTLRNDLKRINKLVPEFDVTSSNLGNAAASLSAGELPFEDVEDIISDRSSRAGAVGTPGGSSPATLRDLGISRLSAINSGNSLFQSMMQGANSNVSPVGDQVRSSSFFVTPQQQGATDLTQAQLVQNSQQNANDLAAAPNPTSAGRLQLELQQANNAASVRSQVAGLQAPIIPNYAQSYGQIGAGVGSFLFGNPNTGSQGLF